jgi:hypothetical protein
VEDDEEDMAGWLTQTIMKRQVIGGQLERRGGRMVTGKAWASEHGC